MPNFLISASGQTIPLNDLSKVTPQVLAALAGNPLASVMVIGAAGSMHSANGTSFDPPLPEDCISFTVVTLAAAPVIPTPVAIAPVQAAPASQTPAPRANQMIRRQEVAS